MFKKKHHSVHILLYLVVLVILVIGIFVVIDSNNSELTESVQATSILTQDLTPSTDIKSNTSDAPISQAATLNYEDWMQKAREFENTKEYSKAISAYYAATSKNKSSVEPYLGRGDLFIKLHSYDKALQEFQELQNRDPENALYHVKVVEARLHQITDKDANDALNDVESRLANIKNPTIDSLYLQCIVESFKGYPYTTSFCSEYLPLSKNDHKKKIVHELITSRNAFDSFQDGDTSYIETLTARSLTEAGFYELSIGVLQHVLDTNKTYRDAWTLLGYNYLLLNKYNLSKIALETAYNLDQTKSHIQYLLAVSYDRLQNIDKAVTFYTLAIDNQYSDRIPIRRRLAELHIANSNFDLAIAEYLRILEEDAHNPEDFVHALWVYIDVANRPEDALVLAGRVYNKHPDNPMAENLLGWAHAANGNLDTAKLHLQKAIQLDTSFAAPYLNLGDVYAKEGNMEKAKAAYEKALTLGKGTSISIRATTALESLTSK